MEPEVVGGSAGHCGLVRCVEADDPKTPISVVDGPATGGVRGAVSRDPWHGLAVPLPPLRRISSVKLRGALGGTTEPYLGSLGRLRVNCIDKGKTPLIAYIYSVRTNRRAGQGLLYKKE